MDIAGIDQAVVADVERETSELLASSSSIDTSNPPGDETRVAEFLADYFRRHGLEGEIVGEPPEAPQLRAASRGSASRPIAAPARPRGRRPGRRGRLAGAAVLRSDQGRVRVGPRRGRHQEPRRGQRRGGVPARGGGRPFAGTVVYAATADEEEGTVGGARWLVENRPDLMHCDYVLNEGGGHFVQERRPPRVPPRDGREGDGAVPHRRAGRGRPRLRCRCAAATPWSRRRASCRRSPTTDARRGRRLVGGARGDSRRRRRLRARLRDPDQARAALAELARLDEGLADMIEPLYGFAFSPTILTSNSIAVNVYPTRVDISVDCRSWRVTWSARWRPRCGPCCRA